MQKKYSFFQKIHGKIRKRLGLQNQKINELMKRPFETKDLLPVPEGWRVGPPDFVGIASGKAGTSWWYRLLIEHPSVKPNRLNRKELCYFYHFGYHGISPDAIEAYRQAFAAPSGSICGEWSPGYLNYPLAIDHLAKAVRDTKLLAIVRNPVDRVLSAQNMQLSKRAKFMNLKGDRAYIYKTFSIFQEVTLHSLLYKSFQQLLKAFDRSQLLLLQYEKCKIDPRSEIAKTYRFLGLDDSYIPASLNRKVNVSSYVLPKFDPEERALLADYFSEDVKSFFKVFPEIELSLWPDFEHCHAKW